MIAVKPNKIDTKNISFQLFKQGKTIADIATERDFSPTTIEGHLLKYVATGEIDIEELIPLIPFLHIVSVSLLSEESITIISAG